MSIPVTWPVLLDYTAPEPRRTPVSMWCSDCEHPVHTPGECRAKLTYTFVDGYRMKPVDCDCKTDYRREARTDGV